MNFPSGTVTFLFTDVEGSTKLAQKHSNEMPALLARHNEILNQAIQNHNGFIFNIVGDSFSAAFHNANNALNAVLEAQFALHKEAWSPAPIKVRMGIHTGPAQIAEDKSYIGYATIALAQRVMSAGHGGQILISQTTHDLLANNLPIDVQLIDMGEHNLKDILQVQRLYQVDAPDLSSDFPPLKTLKIKNHNLPVKLTSFIGRERELTEAKKKLAEARLLTLIGPGGTGKTRLSVQLGGEQLASYPDGVWMVELAPLSDPSLIMQAVASVFGLRESPEYPLTELVTDYLRAKSMLIILDNCEHLIEACAGLAESLIQACSNLKILASSREALGVSGETTYRVPSLLLPDQTHVTREAAMKYESVQLFVERATAANPNFQVTDKNASSIAQVCRRLDGIPLALELAAARARVLSVEQIAERLDDRFRLLTGGSRTALPRQQTLRALIDWSYGLLSESEKALFRRLAVFRGGWTLEAAEKVGSGGDVDEYDVLDLLTQLVDKSLVITEEKDGGIRYHRLETIYQYAREKLLETDEAIDVRNRHLDYFIEYVTQCDETYTNPYQYDIIEKMRLEYDNLRSALSWAIDNQIEKAARLLSISATFWPLMMTGHTSEVQERCSEILAQIASLPEETAKQIHDLPKLKARILNRHSQALMNLGDHNASRTAAEESIRLSREHNDTATLADALGSLGHCALYAGDPVAAEDAAKEGIAISKRSGLDREMIWSLHAMIHINYTKGNFDEVEKYFSKAGDVLKKNEAEFDPVYISGYLIEKAVRQGNMKEAEKLTESTMEIITERRDSYMLATMQSMFAHALRQTGDLDKATFYYQKTIRLWQERGHRAAIAHQLECFGFIAMAYEDAARATKLLSAAETIRSTIHSVRTPAEQKEFEEAKAQLQTGLDAAEFEKVWKEGQGMTLEQAVDLAVEENP